MWNFLRRHLGKIAIFGLIVGAVGLALITRSPQIMGIVTSFVPDLVVGTLTTIGTVAAVAGGATFVGAGAMKVGYELGARDERAKLAQDVEENQSDALEEDRQVAVEGREVSDEIASSLQADIQGLEARMNQLEADRANLLEQENSRIDSQASREEEFDQRITQLETAMSARSLSSSANGFNAENSPRFFTLGTRGIQIRRRPQNEPDNEGTNQFSQ